MFGLRSSLCINCLRQSLKGRKIARKGSSNLLQIARHESTSATYRPLRLGIVGSGPAGFYAAARVMQRIPDARIDMFERLPVPFGLVRYGVAPDHPEVKNCQERFEEVAQSDRFNFVGNVKIGQDISLSVLREYYDALLFAYGASHDRELGVEGEDLQNIHSARAFVGWYNGLPEFADLNPDLTSDGTAVVVGNGNVALDVARILLSGVDALRKTDIASHALEALSTSKVRTVVVAGRRGPMQAAFTIKEIRELLNLPSVGFRFEEDSLVPTADYIKALPRLEQRKYRFAQLLEKGSAALYEEAERHWHLMSLASPERFLASPDGSKVDSVIFSHNRYRDPNTRFEKSASVVSTGAEFEVKAGLVFRSIGYKAEALPGLGDDLGVAFDTSSGTIVNDRNGRALSPDETPVPGVYATGWAQTGPTGVIASTMENAFSSADAIVHDWEAGRILQHEGLGWNSLCRDRRIRLAAPVSWEQWKAIDAAERERGHAVGKEREKFTSVREMLAVAHGP